MKKWIAGLAAALGIGAVATIASARDISVSAAAVQAETATLVATWKAASSTIAGCPQYRVTWTVGGVPTAGKTVTVLTDTLRVTRAAGAANVTASASVVAVCGSKTSDARTASRTVTWPVVVPPPVDSTPSPVDSLRIDTARVVVVPPPDTVVTPPSNLAYRANEPAGMRTHYDHAQGAGSGFYATNGGATAYADASGPCSPGRVSRFRYPGGSGAVTYVGGIYANPLPAGTVRVYSAFCMKLLPGFVMHPVTVKLLYFYRQLESSGSLVVGIEPNGNRSTGGIVFNGSPQTSIEPWVLPSNQGGYTFQRDEWQRVEVLAVMNTPGKSDGVYRLWVNGTLRAQYTNVRYSEGSQPHEWRTLNFDPYYGGADAAAGSMDSWLHVDHWYVATSTTR